MLVLFCEVLPKIYASQNNIRFLKNFGIITEGGDVMAVSTVNGPGALINQGALALSSDTVNTTLVNQGTLIAQGAAVLN